MMMKAIASASQLVPIVDHQMEAFIRTREYDHDAYNPNPHGYWHPGATRPDTVAPDSLIKAHLRDWGRIGPARDGATYRVVLTTRNERERDHSYTIAFGVHEEAWTRDSEACGLELLVARPDAEVITLDFAEVNADPVASFEKLSTVGWPIDPSAAAACVDPGLYRHRAD